MKKLITLVALGLMLVAFSATAQASLIYQKDSHTGNFQYYNEVVKTDFSIADAQTVYIYTDAFAKFGLDTGILIWDANTGKMMGANENGQLTSFTHELGTENGLKAQDAVIQIDLPAGDYIVTLIPFVEGIYADRIRYNTLDQFLEARDLMLPADLASNTLTDTRYSFNIVYAPASAVPIPASALLLAPGLAAIGALRRKFS